MSTIQANAILDASGGNTVTVNGVTPNSEVVKGRNLIINGAMQVAQRGTSATVGPNGTGEGYTTLDRWNNALNHGTAVTTFSQSSDSPSTFASSLKYEVTTAQSSLSSSDFWLLNYRIEGQDLQGVGKGTSSAKQLTLSFWVKATKTGTNNVELTDNDNNRFTTKQFTVDSSNTWEYKTITFDADTTGAFGNDNGSSLNVQWWISAGSNWTSGSITSWAPEVAANRAPGQVNNLDTVGNVFQITGVKLEVGGVATEFDHRSYGEELALCQRYYYAFINSGSGNEAWITTATSYNSSNAYGGVRFPVTMRAIPSLRQYTGTDVWQYYNNNQSDRFDSFTIFGANQTTTSAAMIYNNDVMTLTAGQSGNFQGGNVSCYMHFDAEL